MNGELTKNENLADNAGIRVAYNAYLTELSRDGFVEFTLPGLNYTPKQLFWISVASSWCEKINNDHRDAFVDSIAKDSHSPSDVRVNLALINMREFSQDFHCQLGTKMNPELKCSGLRK